MSVVLGVYLNLTTAGVCVSEVKGVQFQGQGCASGLHPLPPLSCVSLHLSSTSIIINRIRHQS